jgi:hypothetical protein
MGLNFRKSFKIGKLFRVNVSKGGVGLSTGIKGARISVNKKGVRTSVGSNGVYYTKGKSWKSMGVDGVDSRDNNNVVYLDNNSNSGNLNDLRVKSCKKSLITMGLAWLCVITGAIFIIPLFFAIPLFLYSVLNKEQRGLLKLQLAVKEYRKGNIDKSRELLYKADVMCIDNREVIERLGELLEESV